MRDAGARRGAVLSGCARAALLLAAAWPAGAAAQVPIRPPRDSTRVVAPRPPVQRPATPPDSAAVRAAADSAARDSLDADSLRPPLPLFGPHAGPLPLHQRRVFNRDELDWLGARSLGELLAFVPGAFLVRPGWFGTPEFVSYAGQGAASVELHLDGFLLTPLGHDSSALDLNRFDIGLMRRIEVEVQPTVLRVYLVSDVGTVRRPRTEASFATGDAETNTYRGRYLNRWTGGSGVGVAASYFGTNGPGTSPGDVNALTVWSKLTWTPSPLVGVEYTLHSGSLERDSLPPRSGSLPLIPGVNARRSDSFVRAFAATRPDGRGLRFDGLFGTSSYSDSAGTLERTQSQAAAAVSWQAARWALEATSRFTNGATPRFARVRASWAPTRFLVWSAHGQTARRLGGERDVEAGVAAELRPFSWFALYGSARNRDLRTDTTQSVTDWHAGASLRARFATIDVSAQRHGAFRAPGFDALGAQVPRGTTIEATTLTVAYELRPANWFTLHGWYRHPLDQVRAAYEPPHHTRFAATFRSRFLPRFRRGAFDMLIQAEIEGWGDGVIGADALGNPLRLEGATTLGYTAEFRLVGAILFWTLRNTQYERYAIIPGFDMPRGLQRFGIRWEFTN